MEASLMDINALTASLAGSASAAFLGYLYYRHNLFQRECRQRELFKMLEAGQPLPDAEIARTTYLGAIGIVTPIFTFTAAAVSTGLVLYRSSETMVLFVIWITCGLTCTAVVERCTAALGKRGARKLPEEPGPVEAKPPVLQETVSTGIQSAESKL